MAEQILFSKSAHEFFKDLVSDSLAHRRIKIQEMTEFYLVNLLAGFLERENLFAQSPEGASQSEPLAMTLLRALSADREQRYRGLKRLGDTSLFVSGFFGDSLSGSLVDVGYYISMGERAYDALKDTAGPPAGLGELYGELAERFELFVDLFAEISELSNLRSNRGLVRLYERFLLTGSERVANLLRERGVTAPSPPGGKKGLAH